MRASRFLFATLRETPNDAEVISHQLMLRAGMIRKLASGLYTWLPMGTRVLKKVDAIVREEMNRSGAMEVFMPVTQPQACGKNRVVMNNMVLNYYVSKIVTTIRLCLVLHMKK